MTTQSNPSTNPFAPANKTPFGDKPVSMVSNANVNPLVMAPGQQLPKSTTDQSKTSGGIKN